MKHENCDLAADITKTSKLKPFATWPQTFQEIETKTNLQHIKTAIWSQTLLKNQSLNQYQKLSLRFGRIHLSCLGT